MGRYFIFQKYAMIRSYSYQILVIEAKDLKGLDVGGKSDPFVVVSYGPQAFRTSVVKSSTTPVWNEVLCNFVL